MLLECEVSPEGAPVRWLKDGEAVPLDGVIAMQQEGCVRRLLIRSATPADAGTYTCDTGDDAVSFVVTVTGELGTTGMSLGVTLCVLPLSLSPGVLVAGLGAATPAAFGTCGTLGCPH